MKIGEEIIVQILGWRIVIVGIGIRGGGEYFLLAVEGGLED